MTPTKLGAAWHGVKRALALQDPFNEGTNNERLDRSEHESSQEYGERCLREAVAAMETAMQRCTDA